MANELTEFEQQNLEVFKNLSQLSKLKKDLKKQEDSAKQALQESMEHFGITSIDNDYIKITQVAGSESTSIDIKAMQKKEPELYDGLIKDYPKVTKRKPYLKFTVR